MTKILGQRLKAHRRYLRGALLGSLGFCTKHAVDSHGQNPEWLELVKLPLNIKNLPAALVGLKLIHISDLHLSTTVSETYLKRCVTRVNTLKPDLILITGDFVTHDARGRFKDKIAKILSQLQSAHGTFACLGNHDYGVWHALNNAKFDRAEKFSQTLRHCGIIVLRNQAKTITHHGEHLCIIGLGDLWSDDSDPKRAFADAKPAHPKIVLAHNPDAIDSLTPYKPHVVLCGHTHGRQIRPAQAHSPFAPYKNHKYHAGMFLLEHTQLYVNRGLGRLGRPRLKCPPEITLFTLRRTA